MKSKKKGAFKKTKALKLSIVGATEEEVKKEVNPAGFVSVRHLPEPKRHDM
jgi:hypothetical protein